MKRFLFILLFAGATLFAFADTPVLSILTTSQGEVQVAISTIRSITYDKTQGTEMYVNRVGGTKDTYQLSDIQQMTLSGVPVASGLEQISVQEAQGAQKFIQNGVVYVVKDGRVYNLKGEEVK